MFEKKETNKQTKMSLNKEACEKKERKKERKKTDASK